MAVMASTLSEPISLEAKAVDATAQKVSELNGHSEVKGELGSAPLVNGNGKHDESEPSNGIDTKEAADAHNKDAVAENEQISLKAEIKTLPTPQPEPDAEPEDAPAPAPAPAPQVVQEEPSADVTIDVVMDETVNGVEDAEAPTQPADESAKEEPAAAPATDSVADSTAKATTEATKTSDAIPAPAAAGEPASPPTTTETTTETKEDVDMADTEKVDDAIVVKDAAPQVPDSTPAPSAPSAPSTTQEVDLQPASMSQLAIESTENESFSAPTTAEASMTDAPEIMASIKVAREREDDAADEPAAKRARTESQGDAMDIEVAPTEKPKGLVLSDLPGWSSQADAESLTDHQRREFRKVVAGAKKTKAGGHFRDSVEKLWPGVWESYAQLVENPTDLSDIDRRLRDSAILTWGDYKSHLSRLYLNCITFNGAEHEITKSAWSVVDQVWTKTRSIAAEEPPKSRPAPKQMPTRHAEPRATAQPPPRRTSVGVAATATSPTEKAPPAETYAVPPSGIPQVRRASTQNDGDRPKRAIHPPKNKDLDYTPKAVNKKKLLPELRFCHDVLEEISSEKHLVANSPFLHPVDPVALGIPTYFNVIKKPMDLSKLADKLAQGEYAAAKDFEKDMKLMFQNCTKFNPPDTPVHLAGKQLEALFKAEWAKKDQWMAKNAQAKSGSVGASSSHSDAESEAEEEEAAPAPDNNAALASVVAELGSRLQEESLKLTAMFLEDVPNGTMIAVQRAVIDTLQASLLAEKAKLSQAQKEKPAKAKAPKQSKPRASGGASKKATGGAGAKKPPGGGGSSKKAAAKRNLTATEKDLIANAINDLESPNIEKAIELIKKDTGQAENDSGELELDIDQLSNDCLLKLWELCKKALPGFAKSVSVTAAAAPAASNTPAKQGSAKASGGKPKKNKPMSAREQEERIAHLNRLKEMYKDGKTPHDAAAPASAADAQAGDDSSEDSDSEEE